MSDEEARGKPQPVKTVKSSRDIVGVIQTLLVGHARKTGTPLSESDITQLLSDLWLDLEIARTPADDHEARQKRRAAFQAKLSEEADGDLERIKNRLFLKAAAKPKRAGDKDSDLGWDPFTRVLTAPFLHLLADKRGNGLENGMFSRRIVPGLLNATRLLVGDEMIETCRLRCNETLNRLQETALDLDTDKFWQKVYLDRASKSVRAEIFSKLVMRLAKYKRRKTWFLRVLNGELALTQESAASDADYDWQFHEGHFVQWLVAVFATSKNPREYKPTIPATVQRDYGPEGLQVAEQVLRKIHEDFERQQEEGVQTDPMAM
ncbi:MAG: hypothetical protein HOI23_18860 [Deltaproteobacteria bacterium]|jgi:hypothetical protein|nr:hypothetical protein [Deltaproteobacteria bacterium]MBT6432958.1 hypothetical protein [Deltaproteobacteria bacterium]MBT6489612.1 hypothetical protein [Deltaproteobacteria bacterium]